ncbi:uncharacterized protein TDEL_0D03580 [Torulaspora delbrueckii]|uniref:Cysteine-rich transmembrane CYSTM domain-containing protein n=1 Tax=Torulaspora delbrueckii TaxID=4950 RepID=G8ZTJ8_TORDE|nr:hypothetical protein TDEL_0D03580 [Torulaspora delbrueckii]CCE91942.1 hypothetical protein TDEL_0D03580 [Torulaspora delbrueckii]
MRHQQPAYHPQPVYVQQAPVRRERGCCGCHPTGCCGTLCNILFCCCLVDLCCNIIG